MQQLKGSIRDTYLPDIIQLVCQGGNTGNFLFTCGPQKARIYLRAGRIIHAVTTSKAQGLEALEEIATWPDGTYAFEESDTAAIPVSITKPMVLTGFARRVDEWKLLGRVITDVHLFPYPVLLPGETPDLNPRESRLLEFVNGYYTVEELAVTMREPITQIAKTLYGLITAEHVVLKGIRSQYPPIESLKTAAPVAPDPAMGDEASSPFVSTDPFAQGESSVAVLAQTEAPKASPVMQYLGFARMLRDAAKTVLPEPMHQGVDDLHNQVSKQFMIGDVDIKKLKGLASALSMYGVKGCEDGRCTRDHVVQLNTSIKKIFGKG